MHRLAAKRRDGAAAPNRWLFDTHDPEALPQLLRYSFPLSSCQSGSAGAGGASIGAVGAIARVPAAPPGSELGQCKLLDSKRIFAIPETGRSCRSCALHTGVGGVRNG
jgi:hypothetical protein